MGKEIKYLPPGVDDMLKEVTVGCDRFKIPSSFLATFSGRPTHYYAHYYFSVGEYKSISFPEKQKIYKEGACCMMRVSSMGSRNFSGLLGSLECLFYFDIDGNLVAVDFAAVFFDSDFEYTAQVVDGKIILKYFNAYNFRNILKGLGNSDLFYISSLEKRAEECSCLPTDDETATIDLEEFGISNAEELFAVIKNYFCNPHVLAWDILNFGIGGYIRNKVSEALADDGSPATKVSYKWGNVDDFLSYDVETVIAGDTVKLRFKFLNGKLAQVDGIVYRFDEANPVPQVYFISYNNGYLSVSYAEKQAVNNVLTKFGITNGDLYPSYIKYFADESLKKSCSGETLESSNKEVVDRIMEIIGGGAATCGLYIENPGALKKTKKIDD